MFSHRSAVISWGPHWILSPPSTWHLSKGAAGGGTFGCCGGSWEGWGGWCFCTGSIQGSCAVTSQAKTTTTTTTPNRQLKSSIMVLVTTHWPKLQQLCIRLSRRLYTWLIARSLLRTPPLIVRSQQCGSPAELISWELTGGAYCLLICLKRSHYRPLSQSWVDFFLSFFLKETWEESGEKRVAGSQFSDTSPEFKPWCVYKGWVALLWPSCISS